MLDALAASLKAGDPAKFFGSQQHRKASGRQSGSPEGYTEWLHTAPAGTSVHAGAPPATSKAFSDLVLLASCEMPKNTAIQTAVESMLENLGLNVALGPARCGASRPDLPEHIGGMMHFPEPRATKPGAAVAFEVVEFLERNLFEEELLARKRQLGGRMTYLMLPKNDPKPSGEEDEEEEESKEELSAENTDVLWLPAEFSATRQRMRKHCWYGFGETSSIRSRVRKGSTDSGNLKVAIFDAEFEAAKELRGKAVLPSKLCSLLALTMTMDDDTYWMHDNECPEAVAQLMHKISAYWRTTLLSKSDSELGIGASDREVWGKLLRRCQVNFESSCEFAKIRFNCVPGPPRKKRAGSAAAAAPGKARRV
ncbi:unnamed protein product [Symbiodinium natans]|uniref:Uncharacterized protein n=1 Tax=Symbiodinium natans TaxID=878477 RepID=A0A812IEP3_9DINO|nr:unnamed protein product [Symbiodinium natans]